MRLHAALLAAALVQPLGGCLAAGGRISNVVAIDLDEGVNTVPRFAPDGRQGVIVMARRQTPSGTTAPASSAVMVMLPRFAPSRGWDLVGVEDAATGRVADTAPGAAIGQSRAIRFARAKIGGMPATLMFVASGSRQGGMQIVTYRLTTDGDDGSGLAAVFDPIRTTAPRGEYCSPEAALEAVEGLDPGPGGACAGS